VILISESSVERGDPLENVTGRGSHVGHYLIDPEIGVGPGAQHRLIRNAARWIPGVIQYQRELQRTREIERA
jgi:hypothetical protein